MLHGFIRDFFLLLDKAVYTILSVIFQLIVDLANFELFSNEAITSFSNRIYLILGIVMIFKLMISFIQMLINPDNMQDKEKGLGGILKRVVISLVLIVMIRPIFDLSRQLQEKLLPIIPKVILAAKVDTFDDGEVTTSAGNILAYYSFIPFFYPYPGCEGQSHLGGIGNDTTATIYKVSDITSKEAKMKCPESTDEDGYAYRYQYGISTLVGAFLIYVLVTVALKVAIRAIKLSLCEILAPIPIASYIDPKTSKQSFDKWVETSIKTYLDLFTRLAVVYFVIYVFTLLFTSQNNGLTKFQELIGKYNGDTGRALLVALFIIVGLLYFAKEMPKFVTSILGIPEGFSDIGDMFRGQGWRALGGFKDAVDVARSNAVSQYERLTSQGKSKGTALRGALMSSVAGIGSVGARSIKAAYEGKIGKERRAAVFGAAIKARDDRNYRNDVVFADPNTYSRADYRRDKRRERLGIPSENQFAIDRYNQYDEMFGIADKMAKHGMGKKDDQPSTLMLDFKDQSGTLKHMSLGEVYAMSERKEGETYNGRTWTSADVDYWYDSRRRAEKKAQYVKEVDLLHHNDPEATRNLENLAASFQKGQNILRGDFSAIETAFNDKVADPTKQIHSIADLNSVLTNPSTITAEQLEGLKTAFDVLRTQANTDKNNAQAREKMFNQAKQNDKP